MSPTAERIRMLKALGDDILAGDDGFFIFWPTTNKGAYSAHHLREIADLLDEKNAPWEQQINAELARQYGDDWL